MANYNWIRAIDDICAWLEGMEDRQQELVEILRDIGVQSGIHENRDTEQLMSNIDPFSFLNLILKYGDEKKAAFINRILKHIGYPGIGNLSFPSIPSVNNLKAKFFVDSANRENHVIVNLWKLFRQTRDGSIDGELFNEVLSFPDIGLAKLTAQLFVVDPENHLPINGQTEPWLKRHKIAKPCSDWISYTAQLEAVKRYTSQPFVSVSHFAWWSNEKPSRFIPHVVLHGYLEDRFLSRESDADNYPFTVFYPIPNQAFIFDPSQNNDRDQADSLDFILNTIPPEELGFEVQPYKPDATTAAKLAAVLEPHRIEPPQWVVTTNNFASLDLLCMWCQNRNQKDAAMSQTKQPQMPDVPLNQILFGPPGTGKTYQTTEMAVRIAAPEQYQQILTELDSSEQRRQLKACYDQLVQSQRIAFTTFHQSFSYEDFVEGIRAETDDDNGQLRYEVRDGVFKDISDRASHAVSVDDHSGVNEEPKIWKLSIGSPHQKAARDLCFEQGTGRIGWNDAGDLSQLLEDRTQSQQNYWGTLSKMNINALNDFLDNVAKGDVVLCPSSATRICAVGVVTGDYEYDPNSDTGFAHSRNVSWLCRDIDFDIRPLNNNKRLRRQTICRLKRMNWESLKKALNDKGIELKQTVKADAARPNYVLVIDEINRGNIARIFGELITLLEPDKREGAHDARSVTLPYSQEPFSVPSNLYVIGTMNTADRSLTQLDHALRRRFSFTEVMPNYDLLKGINVFGTTVAALLMIINKRITALLDRDLVVGHSYFLPLKGFDEDQLEDELAKIFEYKIIPLLQEYFFSDWEKISWVLNDVDKAEEDQFIQPEDASQTDNLFSRQVPDDISRPRYTINTKAFQRAKAYTGILVTTESE